MSRAWSSTRAAVLSGRLGAVVAFCVITALYLAGAALTLRVGDPFWPDVTLTLVFYAFPVVGVLIAVRRPRNRIAWLCLAIGLVWALETTMLAAVTYATIHPGQVPRPGLLLALAQPLWVPGVGLMGTYLLLLFPDGELPSPRWRPLAWLAGIVMVVWYAVFAFTPAQPLGPEPFPGLDNPLEIDAPGALEWAIAPVYFGCIIASVAALLLRYRRATGTERLQLKWLVAAGTAAIVGLLLINVLLATGTLGVGPPGAWDVVIGASYSAIPAAIGVAVLRYRLYEIDRLISRTVSYAVIVALLGLVYITGVFLFRSLLPVEGDLAVAASTLAAAALFSPLRARVQRHVDRRFNRSRYDADLEMERFAGRLRNHLDLDQLTDDLHTVIDKTVQPSTASMWLRAQHR